MWQEKHVPSPWLLGNGETQEAHHDTDSQPPEAHVPLQIQGPVLTFYPQLPAVSILAHHSMSLSLSLFFFFFFFFGGLLGLCLLHMEIPRLGV